MKQYTAVQGDVWDYLSWKLYNDEGFAHILLAANPALRHIIRFEVPAIINVPDKPQSGILLAINLPPWKRR